MTCNGGATHSAYQPYRAFNMAANATQVGATLVTEGPRIVDYGNPTPSPYPSVGLNPYGPEFPPPPGPYGLVVQQGPVSSPMALGPYGSVPPAEGVSPPPRTTASVSAKPPPTKCQSTTMFKAPYHCWSTPSKVALWASVGVLSALIVAALIYVVMRSRRARMRSR